MTSDSPPESAPHSYRAYGLIISAPLFMPELPVADGRPDVLDILTKVNESVQPEMLLDNFVFQKGKPVSISSFAKSYEQVYEFEKTLADKSGISDVKIISPTFDEKQKRVNFKMTFHYKDFTKTRKR